jgi:hypothetical protein
VWRLLVIAVLLGAVGCGKYEVELAPVRGRVTLDGKGLARATVTFAPAEGAGGPAYAVTDQDGNYELEYTHDRKGAVAGKCIVRIKTGFQSLEDEEKGIKRPETVPAKYNRQSTLTAEVMPDGGPYNFDLISK